MKFADSGRHFWSLRSGTERVMLCAAGGLALAALLYVVLLEPALAARMKLSATLPSLRAQVEDMRLQQKELAVLRKKVAAATQRADLKTLLLSSATRTSFVKSVERIDALSSDRALFVAAPVIFDDWLEWIEGLQREFGIRIDRCDITSTGQSGLVRVEATFAASGQSAVQRVP